MSDVFLGVIAAAVLVMAIIQVAAVIFAARAARRVGEAVARLEQHVQPIVTNLQAVSADAARATAAAAVQVERAGKLMEDLAVRIDRSVSSAQEAILRPARDGLAMLERLRGIFFGRRPASPRNATVDEEDALFIG